MAYGMSGGLASKARTSLTKKAKPAVKKSSKSNSNTTRPGTTKSGVSSKGMK